MQALLAALLLTPGARWGSRRRLCVAYFPSQGRYIDLNVLEDREGVNLAASGTLKGPAVASIEGNAFLSLCDWLPRPPICVAASHAHFIASDAQSCQLLTVDAGNEFDSRWQVDHDVEKGVTVFRADNSRTGLAADFVAEFACGEKRLPSFGFDAARAAYVFELQAPEACLRPVPFVASVLRRHAEVFAPLQGLSALFLGVWGAQWPRRGLAVLGLNAGLAGWLIGFGKEEQLGAGCALAIFCAFLCFWLGRIDSLLRTLLAVSAAALPLLCVTIPLKVVGGIALAECALVALLHWTSSVKGRVVSTAFAAAGVGLCALVLVCFSAEEVHYLFLWRRSQRVSALDLQLVWLGAAVLAFSALGAGRQLRWLRRSRRIWRASSIAPSSGWAKDELYRSFIDR